MKTEKQIIILLKSYETRRNNLMKKLKHIGYSMANYDSQMRIYNLSIRIETIKIILNK